jgi:hypothetical protein
MKHKMPRRRLLLTWDSAAALDGGSKVYSQLSALTLSYNKDPAGHIYHVKALKQAGLYGKQNDTHVHLPCFLSLVNLKILFFSNFFLSCRGLF